MTMPLQLPPERGGRAPPEELVQRRQGMAEAIAAGSWAVDPPPQTVSLGGVRALRFAAPGAPRATVLHLHGGGFRQGRPEMIGPFAAALARRCAVEVVCPAYRLAPEHPFPAGLADARAALTALQASAVRPLILSGDSAGGGLAAGLAALSAADQPRPAALVLVSPWLDLTVASRFYEINAGSDPVFSRLSATEAAGLYLQGASPEHPLASPLFAAGAGFPPSFVCVGEGEVLVEDSRRFAQALEAAGVPARLCVVPGMEHTAVVRGEALTGAAEAFAALAAFVDGVLA
ncbi:MAG TPA: alpha/beta hydrolase fold domain-containing protein [Phenylobacterium sp.]|uniref:alpha/beta hydrolase fold domain-containing protein n=1 Tax=Phenylobacterium sp. TaxID=1871053 RepID=UPI002B45C24A|nr:alpha/beta hydrolase fold domain-containing protein [Phenylobacterium sp.]HKR89185.1 alpha/beta hydrolase fold domain-containing protein [Phenylobacterium sp.]